MANAIDLEFLHKIIYTSSTDKERSRNFINDLRINFDKFVLESNSVFIVGHNNADLDSIGSAVAFAYSAEKIRSEKAEEDPVFDKNPAATYVVVDDLPFKLESSVKKLMADKCVSIRFINKYKCLQLLSDNDFLLVTDVNQSNRVAFNGKFDLFKRVMVVDHHDVNFGTMKADQYFIDTTKSSASEIAYRLLYNQGISVPPDIATAILAGINLDTNNYVEKRNPSLMSLVARLMNREKADDAYITRIIQSNFYADMEIADIILKYSKAGNGILYELSDTDSLPEVDSDESIYVKSTAAIVLNEEKSNKIKLSKVANKLREYADLSFAIGPIEEEPVVSIHARSSGKIDAGKLMEKFGGGGNPNMGSAQISIDTPLEDIKVKVLSLLPQPKLDERTIK